VECGAFSRLSWVLLANLTDATDPVVQAEVNAAKDTRGSSSADGRAKGFWRQSASRLKTFAAC
jgi:hypothetical protein